MYADTKPRFTRCHVTPSRAGGLPDGGSPWRTTLTAPGYPTASFRVSKQLPTPRVGPWPELRANKPQG